MMSTKAVELTNLLNSDLSWKTVAKGSRSATRRTKKQAARRAILDMEAAGTRSTADGEGVGVSDSEKYGVAVLGGHFGNKAEHVPIKKRRFMLNSSSPSLSEKASPRLRVKRQFSGVDAHTWKPKFKKQSFAEDFSGIEILADVACNGGFDDDTHQDEEDVEESCKKENFLASLTPAIGHHAEENTSPSVGGASGKENSLGSSAPAETSVSLQSTSVLSEDNMPERETEDLSHQNNTVPVSPELKLSKDAGNKKAKDDRLHWDLNLSMDAWEQPCDDEDEDTQVNVAEHFVRSETLHGFQDAQIQIGSGDTNIENVDGAAPFDLHGCTSMSSESTESLCQLNGLDKEERRGSCPEVLQNRSCSNSDTVTCLDPAVCDAKGSVQVSTPDACMDFYTHSENRGSKGTSDEKRQYVADQNVGMELRFTLSKGAANVEKCGISSLSTMVSQNCGVHCAGEKLSTMPFEEGCLENLKDDRCAVAKGEVDDSGLKPGKDICSENVKVEKYDASSPSRLVLDSHKIVASDPQLSATLCLGNGKVEQDDYTNVSENMKVESIVKSEYLKLHAEKPQLNGSDICPENVHQFESPSAGDEDGVLPFTSKPEDEPVFTADDCTPIAVEAPGHSVSIDCLVHNESEEVVPEASGYSQRSHGANAFISFEKGANDVPPTSNLGKVNVEGKCDEGYDSDFSRVDKGCVSGGQDDSEIQAGYDSQFEDGELRESDMRWEEHEGDVGEIEHVDYGSEPEIERYCDIDEINDTNTEDSKAEFGPEFDNKIERIERCPSGDASGKSSLSLRKGEPNDCTTSGNQDVSGDGSHTKDSPSRGAGSRPSKRDLPSRVEGSLTSQPLQRGRSNCLDEPYTRNGRNMGSYKFMGRDRSGFYMRGKSPGGRNFSHWDSKNRSPPIYNVYTSGRPRPKSVVENRGRGNGSEIPHLRRQFLNSTNGLYRGISSRKSPGDRDEPYGIHSGSSPGRDNISPERGRFRRYPEGYRVVRGFDRPIPGNSEYRGRLQHRLARRERSNSPVSGRLHHAQLYKKSRSRSRSRSPGPCHRSNRSPNFRPDSRMDRVRLPFQKRFPADHEMGFMSPPRNRSSPPPRNSRWFDDRTESSFRGRLFRPSQRFDSVASIRRVNSEEQFRPPIRPRRFPNVPPVGGRSCKYEGSDEDNNNHGSRYEVVHRVRRYDGDRGMRRLRFTGGQDSFVPNDS